MKKTVGLFLLLLLIQGGCAGKRKPEVAEAQAGRFIPRYGFSIDAQYDSKLDKLLPAYKTLSVGIRNTSLQLIRMEARRDRWIVVDRSGKKIRAINSLRHKDRKSWNRLSPRRRDLIEYPEVVPIGYTVTFNLFFPKKVALEDFRQIWYKNSASGQEFRIYKED